MLFCKSSKIASCPTSRFFWTPQQPATVKPLRTCYRWSTTSCGSLPLCGMANEAPGHSLEATVLVHEAYLRLVGDQRFDGRGHFFAAAAEAMRRILVNHARDRNRLKRGGGRVRLVGKFSAFFTQMYSTLESAKISRYAAVISDPCTPWNKLVIRVNNAAVIPFWKGLLSQVSISSDVVMV